MHKIHPQISTKIALNKEDSWSEPKEPQILFKNPIYTYMKPYYERCKEMKVIEEDGMKKEERNFYYSRKQQRHSKAHQCSWIIKN